MVWEEHEENVDVMMRDNIPVFTEVSEREIAEAPEENYNFLLEGDNLHSLYLLEKTHKGKVDVIYIDPPYNTGSKDFIYDDVFVDNNDGFKHSKWLSFMSERLLIAERLLSERGILVISIGYQEVHNLMVLCQDIFCNKQIVCITVQTSGGKPNGGFTYVHEYLVFITTEEFQPYAMSFTGGIERSPYEGLTLSTFDKTTRPNQVYPIFIDKKTMQIIGVGQSLTERINNKSYTGKLKDFLFDYKEAPEGAVALWPISSKGADCVWRLISSRLLHDWEKGFIKVSKNKSKLNPNEYSVQYLPDGVIKKIESGELEVIGHEEGMPTLILGKNQTVGSEIPTIWTEKDFYTTKGSSHVRNIFEDKRFPYPKPLEYIVEILRAITNENSIILDFFAGSGTTGEAVVSLNQTDGGNRKFILCTNNENNICEDVTYQRIKTVITGKRKDGTEYSEGIPANLKYYRTDFVSKSEEFIADALLEHTAEMIQLEHGIKIDNRQYVMLMSDEEADELECHWDEYSDIKAIYVSQNVLLTATQETLFGTVDIHTMPDCYFNSELREAGELW